VGTNVHNGAWHESLGTAYDRKGVPTANSVHTGNADTGRHSCTVAGELKLRGVTFA